MNNTLILIWILSSIYCIYKLHKRGQATSLDGVTGYTPGLSVIMSIVLGPLLALVDIVITWIKIYKEADEARIRNKKRVL